MQVKALDTAASLSNSRVDVKPPLIAHILYRFAVGGLENGVVNLINRIPEDNYRHVIISLTDATEFKHRLKRKDVEIYCLNKKPGHDLGLYFRLWKLLRRLKPAITHTRNLAALEMVAIAMLAGVKRRVHSEHGWGMSDLNGANRKYRMLRRFMSVLVHRYIGLSKHIVNYLNQDAGIPKEKLTQIYNGVDADRFCFSLKQATDLSAFPEGFITQNTILIGTVGRMEPVKDQLTLVDAFIQLARRSNYQQKNLRLAIIGDGELRPQAQAKLDAADLSAQAWLPGSRDDVNSLMSSMDIFVLPSRNEGISNTILEAMASGLPVIATRVGGNPELVVEGTTGVLVPSENVGEMTNALEAYVENEQKRQADGQAARELIAERFRLEHMVDKYISVYDDIMLINIRPKEELTNE
ncbi:MAG: TIGR03088 family PEP-CTERM/XrtA system glycosyltransferase [Gammaproteobacteria bacterium]|nr:TIGR03088 family PEP-CTERM/XrtA system glycosyltransferase [Gammaproteobacteria bacterium]